MSSPRRDEFGNIIGPASDVPFFPRGGFLPGNPKPSDYDRPPQVYRPPQDRDDGFHRRSMENARNNYGGAGPMAPDSNPLNIKQVSPFATSIRPPKDPRSLFTNSNVLPADGYTYVGKGSDPARTRRIDPSVSISQGIMGNRNIDYSMVNNRGFPQRPQQHQMERPELMKRGPQQPNPFEGNEQYQALLDYQKSMRPNEDQRAQMQSLMDAMQPNQEQRDRMGELRTAFEGTGGYKDYRIQQMEQQMNQMNQMRNQRQGRMGGGLGSQRPQGMGMYGGFPQRPQRMPQGIMGGYGRPQQNSYGGGMQGGYGQQSSYQQPQQMGGYGGYGGYGQPQQNPYGGMQGGYGGMNNYQQPQMPQPQYQPYQSPYQQSQPQPQQYGGYGMGQSQGGFGGYGGMSNPYQPQQYGNQNNYMR